MTCNFRSTQSAFTLVELSIVIVIIGLLMGGVLVGQDMIRNAELRSLTHQFEQYQTALGAFKNKYSGMPGDLKNAVRYWGEAAGATTDGVDAACAALTHTSPSTGTETCNGNGDGLIVNITTPQNHELYRSWQHLANAGLVEGSYTGVPSSAGPVTTQGGLNMPKAKDGKGIWVLLGAGYLDSGAVSGVFEGDYGNTILLNDADAAPLNGALLTAVEAFAIDEKLDDGKPQSGNVRSPDSSVSPNCVVGTDDAYNTTTTGPACVLIFISGY